ncbi:MAG TPA: SBBP repeat-containing protein, partial [Candidatus Angelobacter sp.]|nr:SBBP repeat-containing protein [Candidatus Angelobacter sp.]
MKNLLLGFLSFALLAAHFSVAAAAQVSFEKNEGQWPAAVRYMSTGAEYWVALTPDGLRLSPTRSATIPEEVTLRWIGSNVSPEISVQDPLPYHSNYFFGNNPQGWKTSVSFFGKVVYQNIYPGISVSYHGKGNEIEQDIHIEPGGDTARFRFQVEGAKKVFVGSSGELVLESGDGSFSLALPKIYQLDEHGQPLQVAGHYALQGSIVSFQIDQYNHREKLIIDPVLSYSTYLPKVNLPSARLPQKGFSVNSSGSACITDGQSLYGYDANGNVVFTVANPFNVAKVVPVSVFEDEQGNCFAAGEGPVNSFGQHSLGVAKLSPVGSLVYTAAFSGTSTIGGLGSGASQIVADSSGNAYVIGTTDAADFPLKNPIQNLLKGSSDVVILKLDPTGSSLVYSTYFGADNVFVFGSSTPSSIAIDTAGNAYLAGGVNSTSTADSSIPVTSGVFQGHTNSSLDAWVAKIDPNGKQIYGTYLGGSAFDTAFAVAADSTGNAYVVGGTCSADFPTKNAFQPTLAADCSGLNVNSERSAFLSKISPDGSALVYSTYLGGSDGAIAAAIALDSSGAPYLVGDVGGANFPLLNPIQADFLNTTDSGGFVNTGISQIFVTAFDSSGSALQYSTFFGGFNPTFVEGIGVDAAHNVYFGGAHFGSQKSPTPIQSFPILNASNGVFQPLFQLCFFNNCGFQGFVAKISAKSGTALASPATVDFGTVIKGQSSLAVQLLIANVGSTDLTVSNTSITGDYSISNNTCVGALLSAKHCDVDIIFGPTAGGTRTGVLTLTSTAP